MIYSASSLLRWLSAALLISLCTPVLGDISSFKVLAELSRAVLVYANQRPDLNLRTREFVVIGHQTVGKSTGIANHAKGYIGGSIKADVGTRCTIMYIFQYAADVSYKVGVSLELLLEVDKFDVFSHVEKQNDYVKQHSPTGFSDDVFYVVISGPDIKNFVMKDKPGIHPGDEAANAVVYEMWGKDLSKEDTVPIVIMAPHKTYDSSFLDVDLMHIFKGLRSCSSQAIRKAIFVFNFLNHAKGAAPAAIVAYRDHLVTKFTDTFHVPLLLPRIVFLSYKPHLLNPTAVEVSRDPSDPLFDVQAEDDLIRRSDEFEDRYLDAFVDVLLPNSNRGKDYELYFGMKHLSSLIDEDVVAYMKENYATLVKILKSDGKNLLSLCENMVNAKKNYWGIVLEVDTFVRLFTDGLKALSTTAEPAFMTNLAFQSKFGPVGGQITFPRDETNFVSSLAVSFDDDRAIAESTLGRMTFASNKHLDIIRSSNSNLAKELRYKLSGPAAVYRLIGVFKHHVMTMDLKTYAEDEIWNMMGFECKQDFRIDIAIQKIVEQNNVVIPSEELIRWSIDIYVRMLYQVLHYMNNVENIQLLNEYPKLKEYVNQEIISEYKGFFDVIREELEKTAGYLTQVNFATSGLSRVTSLIKLLGSSGIVDLAKMTRQAEQNAPTSAIRNLLSYITPGNMKFMTSMFSSEPVISAELGVDWSSVSHTFPQDFELISSIAETSAADFAFVTGINLNAVSSPDDMGSNLDKINRAAASVTRLSSGILAIQLHEMIKSSVILVASQICSAVSSHMSVVSQKLRVDDYRLLKELIKGDEGHLDHFENKLKQIDDWFEITKAIPDDEVLKKLRNEILPKKEAARAYLSEQRKQASEYVAPEEAAADYERNSGSWSQKSRSEINKDQQLSRAMEKLFVFSDKIAQLEKDLIAQKGLVNMCRLRAEKAASSEDSSADSTTAHDEEKSDSPDEPNV